ncbi:MAG: hypothetical protein GY906_28420 [bacterium]|nr:hypothetical protein [bacterium]
MMLTHGTKLESIHFNPAPDGSCEIIKLTAPVTDIEVFLCGDTPWAKVTSSGTVRCYPLTNVSFIEVKTP